jgi:hypothetical protein
MHLLLSCHCYYCHCAIKDLGTEIAPVMSFAFEKPDDDVMLKQPRRAVVPKDVLLEPSEVADMERATHIEVRALLRVTRRLP